MEQFEDICQENRVVRLYHSTHLLDIVQCEDTNNLQDICCMEIIKDDYYTFPNICYEDFRLKFNVLPRKIVELLYSHLLRKHCVKVIKHISYDSFILYTEILRRVQLIGLQSAQENQDILSNLVNSLRNLYSVLLNMNISIEQKLTIINDINEVWERFKRSVYLVAYGRILVDNVDVLDIMKEEIYQRMLHQFHQDEIKSLI